MKNDEIRLKTQKRKNTLTKFLFFRIILWNNMYMFKWKPIWSNVYVFETAHGTKSCEKIKCEENEKGCQLFGQNNLHPDEG